MNLDRVREYLLETSRTAARTADECGEQILGATAAIVRVPPRRRQAPAVRQRRQRRRRAAPGDRVRQHAHASTGGAKPIAAIALTTDTSLLTAVANDFGFDGVFERQVEALGREGDVLVGISTSGNSENVVRAFAKARSIGLRTIAMIGASSGKLGALADIEINVPSSETSHIQEAHIAVGQLIAFLVEDELYPR